MILWNHVESIIEKCGRNEMILWNHVERLNEM